MSCSKLTNITKKETQNIVRQLFIREYIKNNRNEEIFVNNNNFGNLEFVKPSQLLNRKVIDDFIDFYKTKI